MMRPASRAWVTAAALLGAALSPGVARAASRPVLLDPAYVDPAPPTPPAALKDHACALHVVDLRDARRDPAMVGLVIGKPVRTPPDRTAWLGSIVGALHARGYDVDFADPGSDRPDGLNARITLQTLWIDTGMDLHQSAVFHVQARGIGGQIDGFYRGSESHLNWVTSDHEVKSGLATALARALDAMATALAPLCQRPTAS